MDRRGDIDMRVGPILPKLALFALPVVASGILQLMFHTADVMVVGRFSGSLSLAAVGSVAPLIHLLLNVFMGLSIGANVLCSHFYGAGKDEDLSQMSHTAMAFALVCGLFLLALGLTASGPLLRLMGSPEEVRALSQLYLNIYFFSMPGNMAYNFGAAILRAVGDSRSSLRYLVVGGLVNVSLNLVLVVGFGQGVAGVAYATVISQCLSAFLVWRHLSRAKAAYGLRKGMLRIHRDKLLRLLQIGLPAGIQGSLFALSNVVVQSTINQFGAVAMAGNTASGNLEGIVYTGMNSMSQATVSFVGQNAGARLWNRVRSALLASIALVTGIGLVLGNGVYLAAPWLLSLFNPDPQVLAYGQKRLFFIVTVYFLCGNMDVLVGALRGLGHAVLPMIVALTGACLFRIFWVLWVFPRFGTLESLYIAYPISWTLTALVLLFCFVWVFRRQSRDYA